MVRSVLALLHISASRPHSTRARGSIPSVCLSWAGQEESCALVTCLGEAHSGLMHTKGFVLVWVVLIGTGLAIYVQTASSGWVCRTCALVPCAAGGAPV